MAADSTILSIGERVHASQYRDQPQRVAYWKKMWTGEKRIRYILSTPAMSHGSTRTRFTNVFGMPRDAKVVNLLWPDSKSGTWDEREAFVSALTLTEWLERDGTIDARRVTGLLLLGRRVASAFVIDGEPEFLTTLNGPRGMPMLVVPHPSGRSRKMNDATFAESVRDAIDKLRSAK